MRYSEASGRLVRQYARARAWLWRTHRILLETQGDGVLVLPEPLYFVLSPLIGLYDRGTWMRRNRASGDGGCRTGGQRSMAIDCRRDRPYTEY